MCTWVRRAPSPPLFLSLALSLSLSRAPSFVSHVFRLHLLSFRLHFPSLIRLTREADRQGGNIHRQRKREKSTCVMQPKLSARVFIISSRSLDSLPPQSLSPPTPSLLPIPLSFFRVTCSCSDASSPATQAASQGRESRPKRQRRGSRDPAVEGRWDSTSCGRTA